MQYSKFFIAGILILPASCQQMELLEPPQAQERQELNIQGVINQEYLTRANDEGFVDGDRMGVFVVDYENGLPGKLQTEDNRANNMCYTYNEENGSWKGAGTIYWRDKNTPVDVYGYYPFVNVVSSIENYEFEVKINQNKKADGGDMSTYEASDFLWAKTSGAEYGRPITLTYGHLMAGVQVILQKGEGFTDTEWSKLPKVVSVDNTIRKAVVNLEKGVVTADGAYDQNVILSDEGSSYRGVVVPQTVEAGKSIIGVTIDGVSYNLKKDVLMTYISGKLHTFTVTVDKRTPSGDYQLSITDEQVAAWENDKSSHSFEGKAYVVVHVEKEGTLKECLVNTGVDVSSVKNLKITGKMTTEDFEFIRSEMGQLEAINIKDVKIIDGARRWRDGGVDFEEIEDDLLPSEAFKDMLYLRSIILPAALRKIGDSSFENLKLTTSLVLPNSATHIYEYAFTNCHVEIELSDSLQYIGNRAFMGSGISGMIKLPNTLKYIGESAFSSSSFSGYFYLPEGLEYIGSSAFSMMDKLSSRDIVVPKGITKISPGMFVYSGGTNKHNLMIHSNVTEIGDNAFASVDFYSITFGESVRKIGKNAFRGSDIQGQINLPKDLNNLGSGAFKYSSISGFLKLPDNLYSLISEERNSERDGTFQSTEIEELEGGMMLTNIQASSFEGCDNLKKVFLKKYLERIGSRAFADCFSLETVVLLTNEPPIVEPDAFDGVDLSRVVLEVPEVAVEKFRSSPVWNLFGYITAYRELASVSEITVMNKEIICSEILRAEGPWEVISCPEWCEVSPMSSETKAEVTFKIAELPAGAGNREGQILFKLKDKDYSTYTTVRQYDYEYPEDTEIMLQKSSEGAAEIPIFIIGDGFAAEDIVDGSYLEVMNQQIEYFFDIEPYRTYREFFTVSTSVVCSLQSGIDNWISSKGNYFETNNDNGTFICNYDLLKDYVKNVSSHINDGNLNKALIILVVNSNCFGGNVYIEDDGTTICFCPLSNDSYPYDQRGIIQHYAGGRGFGKLAQEDTYHYDFMSLCPCLQCNKTNEYYWAKERGWYDNVSLSYQLNDVPWSHLIFHEKYSHLVDVYEGALGHARGVYRSEINSCMNTYIPYYNTISRESIVRRIMDYAGKEYSFDDFVANDKIEKPE